MMNLSIAFTQIPIPGFEIKTTVLYLADQSTAILRHGFFNFRTSSPPLAPDIVEAIIEGRQPRSLTLTKLLSPLPLAWAEQRRALRFEG